MGKKIVNSFKDILSRVGENWIGEEICRFHAFPEDPGSGRKEAHRPAPPPGFLFITVGFYVSICFVSLFFLKSWYNVVIILLFLQWTFM